MTLANGVAERWVGNCRRELLDHVIAVNEIHLRRLLASYVDYYHADRIHCGLQKQTPKKRTRCVGRGRVIAWPRVGGLHHRYERAAWIGRYPGSCRADRLFYAQRYVLLPAMQPCRRSDWLLISIPVRAVAGSTKLFSVRLVCAMAGEELWRMTTLSAAKQFWFCCRILGRLPAST
jgi:putative transposase